MPVPWREVGAGESADLRWLSLDELRSGVGNGEVLKDVVVAYEFIVRHASEFATLPAGDFSINKPAAPIATYKRGAVERAN